MFTIKFYGENGSRVRIFSAESFTILRNEDSSEAEITLHQKNSSDDFRIDILPRGTVCADGCPPYFQKAIIENDSGRTTAIIVAAPARVSLMPKEVA